MEKFDLTVIGAGIVGLAVSSRLPAGDNLVIEKNETFGRETSSRNSEVIHAGIYYPQDSFKARLCVSGNEMIYQICAEHNINHQRLGKIIVAVSEDEREELEVLYEHGRANGVRGLELLAQADVKRLEPKVRAVAGIYSPSTGIVDTHSLMRHFELRAKDNGVTFAYGCTLVGIERVVDGYQIKIKDVDGEVDTFFTRVIINSAGLQSDQVARMAGVDEYCLHYCKGEYFSVGRGKQKNISHLVYPCPTKVSLGVHTVVDLQGQMKLGPNAFYVDKIDYEVDSDHLTEMYESASRYLPFLDRDDLTPDLSGIRPKLQAPGAEVKDFVISEESDRDLPGFINLIGIESPGLTASPANAEYIVNNILKGL